MVGSAVDLTNDDWAPAAVTVAARVRFGPPADPDTHSGDGRDAVAGAGWPPSSSDRRCRYRSGEADS